MSVYNGSRYVSQAIDSILTQKFADLELVIIDDGSTDDTTQILASYQDHRITWIENEHNLGLTKSLNVGIRAARGELIARQDADDVSLPDRLEQQIAYLDGHPNIGLIGAGSLFVDAQGSALKEWRPLTEPVALHQTLLWTNPFIHGTFVFRRSCLPDINGGYDEALPVAQDPDLLYRISERWDVAALPDILYIYRQHGDAITANRLADQQHYHQVAVQAAIRRRLAYARKRLELSGVETPDWVMRADRRWLAQRYLWWSAAARMLSRPLAVQLLGLALLLDPTAPGAWLYMLGIMARKIGLGIRHEAEFHQPHLHQQMS